MTVIEQNEVEVSNVYRTYVSTTDPNIKITIGPNHSLGCFEGSEDRFGTTRLNFTPYNNRGIQILVNTFHPNSGVKLKLKNQCIQLEANVVGSADPDIDHISLTEQSYKEMQGFLAQAGIYLVNYKDHHRRDQIQLAIPLVEA